MNRSLMSLALVSVLALAGAGRAMADSLSDVEEARAYERSGRGLTDREIDALRRYGGNDGGYYYRGYGDYAYGSVYIGPPRRGYVEPGYNEYDPYDEPYDDRYDDEYYDDDYYD